MGRSDNGYLTPDAGQAFLDELPYMLKGAYAWAEPAGVPFDDLPALLMA